MMALCVAVFVLPIVIYVFLKVIFEIALYQFPIEIMLGDFQLKQVIFEQAVFSEYVFLSTLFVIALAIYLLTAILGMVYALVTIFTSTTLKSALMWSFIGFLYGGLFSALVVDRNELGIFIVNHHIFDQEILSNGLKAQFIAVDQLMLVKDRFAIPCAGVMLACLAMLSVKSIYNSDTHVFQLQANRNRINVLVYLAGMLFMANVTCLLLITRWSAPIVSENMSLSLSMLRASVTLYWGAVMGFCFAAAFLPALLIIIVARKRAFTMLAPKGVSETKWYHENDLQLTTNDLTSRVFAFGGPMLIGPMLEFVLDRM